MSRQRSTEAAADYLEEPSRGEGLCIDGLVIDVSGLPPIERHYLPDVRRDVFSVSKSITSIAVGIAAAENVLGLDDRVLDHLSGFRAIAAPGVERVTVRHLLTMTSGIVYRWADPDFDHLGDPAADLAGVPARTRIRLSGSQPLYPQPHPACRHGTGHARLPHSAPVQPARYQQPSVAALPLGYSIGSVGLELRTNELARVARALRDGGVYDGRQVIPIDYVSATQHDGRDPDYRDDGEPFVIRARGYGLSVWLWEKPDAWLMSGLYGQTAMIVPSRRLAVTTTAQYDGHNDDIHNAIWDTIVEHL